MNITPIESILHHRPNCNCEACARNLKPFRAGRFVDKEEMDGIHAHVQELAAENERLSALLVQLQKREEERAELAKVEAIRQEQRAELAKAEAMRQEAARQEKRRLEEDSDEEEPVRKKMKTVTIVMDNTKLIYLGIMIVVLIMVLKK
jgi:hypothetical protein